MTKTTRHIAIFNRFQIIFKSFIRAIFHINSSNQDKKNGVSYIRIGCQIKKMIFSSNLPATAVSKGVNSAVSNKSKMLKLPQGTFIRSFYLISNQNSFSKHFIWVLLSFAPISSAYAFDLKWPKLWLKPSERNGLGRRSRPQRMQKLITYLESAQNSALYEVCAEKTSWHVSLC